MNDTGLTNINILLVEDNPHNATVLKLALNEMNKKTNDYNLVISVLAKDVFEADRELAKVGHEDSDINLIVLDEKLPHCNGSQWAGKLRAEGNEIPIIFASSRDMKEEAKSLGAVGVFRKPYEHKDLQKTVASALNIKLF